MRLGAPVTARQLTDFEVAGLLARHPGAAARVAYHNTTSTVYCYPVGEDSILGGYSWERENLGIPWQGLYVEDAQLGGLVSIFSDADCDLRYTLTGGLDPGVVTAPLPAPVPHEGSVLTDLRDFANLVLPIAALFTVAFAWRSVK